MKSLPRAGSGRKRPKTADNGLGAVKRTLCIAVLNLIPEAGIDEVFETLRDIYLYHLPSPPPMFAKYSGPQVLQSVVSQSSVRGPLIIDTD